jgi:hypothetical protein
MVKSESYGNEFRIGNQMGFGKRLKTIHMSGGNPDMKDLTKPSNLTSSMHFARSAENIRKP